MSHSRSADDWASLAVLRVRDLVVDHGATVIPEVVARLGPESGPFASSGEAIDPHHITTALRQLTQTGVLRYQDHETRGGRSITTVVPTNQQGRATSIQRAAARKRLLYARYESWSQGSKHSPHGLVGPAGERAFRSAVTESGVMVPIRGDDPRSRYLDYRFEGPVDWIGLLPRTTPPLTAAVAVVEVKNVRSWLYPASEEVYQLLAKSAGFQRAYPGISVVPILVCRRAHRTMFFMAKQMGFFVIDTNEQPTGVEAGTGLDEVRQELGFADLRAGSAAPKRAIDRLKSIQGSWPTFAESWRSTSLNDTAFRLITALRNHKLSPAARSGLKTNLAQHFTEIDRSAGW